MLTRIAQVNHYYERVWHAVRECGFPQSRVAWQTVPGPVGDDKAGKGKNAKSSGFVRKPFFFNGKIWPFVELS
jgi:hypothetical protein